MKKKYLMGVVLLLLIFGQSDVYAQGTETFESPLAVGSTVFTRAGLTFDTQDANFDTELFASAGAGGSDRFLDNIDMVGTNSTYSLSITGGGTLFTMQSMEMYVSSIADGAMPTDDGTMTFVGRVGGVAQFTYTKPMGTFPTAFGSTNGFFLLDFAALPGIGDVSSVNIDEIEFTINGAFQYVAVDNFEFDNEVLLNDPPEVQSISIVGSPTSTATTVDFSVVFNEPAINVDTTDFSIDAVGTTGTISSVTGSGTTYTVSVTGISGEGTISIDLIAGNDIEDSLGNTPSPAFTTGEAHVVSRCFQETFESTMIGDFMFASNGVAFTTGSANFDVEFFANAGAGDSDQYIDNVDDQGTGKIYSITTTGTELFTVEAVELYLSSNTNGLPDPTDDGTLTVRGKLAGSALYTITKNTGFPTSSGGATNGFFNLDFATAGASDFSLTNIDELEFEIGGAFVYIAIDNFEHCEEISTSSPPIVQNITLVGDPAANSNTVDFEVIFNEDAINVSLDDFTVTTMGTATGMATGISGSGNNYIITVTGISGEGSIRLDLNNLTDIEDSDGNTPPDPFVSGEIHFVSSCNIETYESLTIGTTSYSTNGKMFSTGTSNFSVSEFIGAGGGGSDRYLDNLSDQGTNKTYSISITDATTMQMGTIELYTSSELNGANPTDDGTVTIRGKLGVTTAYTIVKNTGFPTTFGTTEGFFTIDFATDGASDFSMIDVDEVEIEIGDSFSYVALDNFKYCLESVPPMAVCQDFTAQLDASGSVTITAADIDNGSTDNVAIASLSVSPDTFDCSDVGTSVTVTLTVTDTSGNTDTCNAMVTVVDITPPVIICLADLTVECDASTLPADTGSATATDNCDMAPVITFTDVVVAGVGNNSVITRTWTATDANSNASSCDQIITVTDTMAPVITCPADLAVECDASTLPADTGNATATDNCDMAPVITFIDVVVAGVGNNSVITRTWTATDANSNASSCDQIITVTDTMAPVITCPADLTVECDASTLPADTGSATATDNCDMTPVITFTDVVVAGVGNNSVITRTWTATDANSNASSCDQIITVTDTMAPVITCPADLTVECDASTLPTDTGSATATDNCDMAPVITFTDVVVAGVGNNSVITRTWTATDANSNASSCDQIITVTDTMAPVITCPADLTVECDASTLPADTGSATATDNCDMTPVITFTDVVVAGVGNNSVITRTWTATDANSNASSCDQIITVTDTMAPVITCPADLTVECDASTLPTDTGSATATDNCDMAPVITFTDVVVAGVGNNSVITRTWTATDANSNASSCDQIITVTDTMAPVITCPADLTVECDASTLPADTGSATATDNCDMTPVISFTDVVVAGVGNNSVITRTWTATDANSNASSCDQIITVTDTMAPVITCPADLTVECDASTLPADTGNATATDNCDMAPVITFIDVVVAGVGNNSVITRTWTATDANSNASSCDQIITVTDTMAPVITCPADLTVECDASTLPADTGSATATDNCDMAPVITFTDVVVAGVGNNSVITRTWTATDANSNASSCDQIITVTDTMAPVITCPADLTVECDASTLPTDTGSATATDNCDMAPVITFTDVVVAGVGNNSVITRTWTATDANSNATSCDQIITVVDTTAPTAICVGDFTLGLDMNGNAVITAADIDNGSFDSCGAVTTSIDITNFTCADVNMSFVVTLTVTDLNMNSSTCTTTVTIEDNLGVTVISGPVDIFTGTGPNDTTCSTVVNYDASINSFILEDNCSDPSMVTITQTGGLGSGALFPVGITTEEYTLTDINGNDTLYTFNVSITDTTIPLIDCPDDVIVSGENGEFIIPDFTNLVTDNCSVGSDLVVIQTPSPGTVVSDPSVNTVMITATDAAGNIANCEFTLTVDATLGIDDILHTANQISLYPNPATSQISLKTNDIAIRSIALFDLNGRLIATKDFVSSSVYIVDVSRLSEGVYYLSIETGETTVVKRFIKK